MRINPFALFVYNHVFSNEEKIKVIHNASMLTHAHKRSLIGCGIYSFILWELIDRPCKESIHTGLLKAKNYYKEEAELEYYKRIFDENFKDVVINEIKSSGYVVDTLEASIWCLFNTNNYEDCVLKAVNLGYDTDTVGAVTGGLAGLLYGFESIPKKWLNSLQKKDMLEKLCVKFFDAIKK